MSKPPRIVLFEHDRLTIGRDYLCADGRNFRFEARHFDALARFAARGTWKPFTLGHRSVSFGGFVGTLCVGRLLIEILPKADKHAWRPGSSADWQDALNLMLQVARTSRLDHATSAPLQTTRSTLLELYIARFLTCVEQLLHRGLVRRYRRVEGNLTSFRGKMLVASQIRHNVAHAERFFVEFTTYDHQHLANTVLLAALHIVRDLPVSQDLHGRCLRCLLAFPEMEPPRLSPHDLRSLALDRVTERYREALDLARLLLLHHSPAMQSGDLNVLAILVEMSSLFEDFLGQLCRRVKLPGLKVSLQRSVPFWSPDDGPVRKLRPDIVLDRDGHKPIVLDAKWKVLPASGPSIDDVRQIYAYNQYLKASHSVLLYPHHGSERPHLSGLFDQHDHRLSTATLKLVTSGPVALQPLIDQVRLLIEGVSVACISPSKVKA